MPRRYHSGYVGAVDLRKLHGRRADGARCAVDQDSVAGSKVELLQISVRIPGTLADDHFAKALFSRHDGDSAVCGQAYILCVRAVSARC